ncbi:hypothetical protein HaLaN_01154, partial [Haematococcus lacustris]
MPSPRQQLHQQGRRELEEFLFEKEVLARDTSSSLLGLQRLREVFGRDPAPLRRSASSSARSSTPLTPGVTGVRGKRSGVARQGLSPLRIASSGALEDPEPAEGGLSPTPSTGRSSRNMDSPEDKAVAALRRPLDGETI